MTYKTVARVALGYLTLNALVLGLWALLAPQSFYDGFPGAGRSWVSVDGPFNEHLIRDVGALNLALAVLLIAATMLVSRHLVVTAAIASLAWSVPHFIYHASNTEPLSTGDNVLSLGGLALGAGIPLLLIWLAPKVEADGTAAATS